MTSFPYTPDVIWVTVVWQRVTTIPIYLITLSSFSGSQNNILSARTSKHSMSVLYRSFIQRTRWILSCSFLNYKTHIPYKILTQKPISSHPLVSMDGKEQIRIKWFFSAFLWEMQIRPMNFSTYEPPSNMD